MIYDVIILTDNRYVNDSTDPYKHTVFHEDDLVKQALIKLGLKAHRLSWDDPDFNWADTKSILFRTTWDYFDRFDEFSTWLEHVSKVTKLINSKDIIYWNIDKHYLKDLHNNGIRIAETHFIEPKTKTTLKTLHKQLGWTDTVLKPCISGAARHTYKLNTENLDQHETIFQELIAKESMMLSPFQHHIVDKGEVSMMVFNGEFTHAILKVAKEGDFRVQDDYGGTVHEYQASKEEIAFAEQVVKACKEQPLYARVDIFTNNNDELAVLELELIEPELWFRYYPEAANVLAKAIKKQLHDY